MNSVPYNEEVDVVEDNFSHHSSDNDITQLTQVDIENKD